MRSRMTERGRLVLAMLLVGSLLAMFAGALPVAADDPPNPVRALPTDPVVPGQEFEVVVTFSSPDNEFNSIGLNDAAPAGWLTTVDEGWVSPSPLEAHSPEPDEAEIFWYGNFAKDTAFTVMYKVEVPANAEEGIYHFSGVLEYYIAGDNYQEAMGGQQTVTVGDPTGNGDSGEVDLIAHTPPEKGSIELIKLFVPGDADYPDDDIDVQVTGPHDFNETYTLTRGEGWEKTVDNIPVGTYMVEELTFVFGWIASYDPDNRQLEVVAGETATMTITNTHTEIGISVSPSLIDFGEITPGEAKAGDTITVTNTGSVAADVRAEVDVDTTYNDGGDHFYTDALRLAGVAASGRTGDDLGSWTADELGLEEIAPAGGSADVTTAVACPELMYPDREYTGKLLFIGSASD